MQLNLPAAARKRRETDTDTVRWEGHAKIWVETHEETRKAGQRGTHGSRGLRRKVPIRGQSAFRLHANARQDTFKMLAL